MKSAVGTATTRRAMSRNAALAAARYQLLTVIRGVKLEGGISISQLMEKDSLMSELANDMVKGGEEVLVEWTTGGDCVVTLELKRSKVEHLILAKSEREKKLEQELFDMQVQDQMDKRISYYQGKADADAQREAMLKHQLEMFGYAHDPGCWNPLWACYWNGH